MRTKVSRGNFEFTSGSADLLVILNSDYTAEGNIGSAIFENAKIKKNWGNPEKRGIAIKIECGSIGKIIQNC